MFCSKCGKEIPTDSRSCIYCKTPIESNQLDKSTFIKDSNIYSKDDYLSLSKEYENEKKKIKKSGRNMIILGGILFGLGVLIIPTILIIIMDQMLIPLIVSFLGIIVGTVFWGVSESTTKKRIDELGDNLYRKYVSDFNIKK